MNQKIKQLAADAGLCFDGFGDPIWGAADADFLEKFAQLVATRCADFAEPMPGSRDIDDVALARVQSDIKQYFGIKG